MRGLQVAGLIVLLRPKSFDPPDVFEGDVDVLYNPRRFDAVLRTAVTSARELGVSLLIDQTAPAKKRISFFRESMSHRILLELWPYAEVLLGRDSTRPRVITWNMVEPLLERAFGPTVSLPAEVESALYLAHLFHKRKSLSSEEVQKRLSHYLKRLESADGEVALALRETFAGVAAAEVDLENANERAVEALSKLRLRPRLPATATLDRARRKVLNAIRSRMPEPLVPVVGPDGAGKTTLISQLESQHQLTSFVFKSAFRYSLAYRAMLRVVRRWSDIEQNLIDERLTPLMLMIARARWPIAAHRRRVRAGGKRPVLVDRYFWDYLLKLREAGRPPRRIAGYRLFSAILPFSRRAVILICPVDAMLARKQELSRSAIEALYAVYCDQVARTGLDQTLVQSTDGPVEACTSSVASFLSMP